MNATARLSKTLNALRHAFVTTTLCILRSEHQSVFFFPPGKTLKLVQQQQTIPPPTATAASRRLQLRVLAATVAKVTPMHN